MAYSGTITNITIDQYGNTSVVVDFSDGTSHITDTILSAYNTPIATVQQRIVTRGTQLKTQLDRMTATAAATQNGTVNPYEQYIGAVVQVP